MTEEQPKAKSKRGLASMSPEKRREIASMGGKSVPAEKRAFSNPGLASAAGKKGGSSVNPQKRALSRDPALASSVGAKGAAALKAKGARSKEP